jgi:hypothetical protein
MLKCKTIRQFQYGTTDCVTKENYISEYETQLLSPMNWVRWYCNYSLLQFVLHRDRLWDHACQYEYGFREDIAYWSHPMIQRCIKFTDVLQFSLNYHIRDIANLLEWYVKKNELELQRESLSHVHIHIYIYIYICVCVCVCVYIYIYIYIYIYTINFPKY